MQVLNKATQVVETHRAVYAASTPVSLPSSVNPPAPPVPELPPPASVAPSTGVHVRFAPMAGDEDDTEIHTPKPKKAVSTPFHKRAISQLPPIVAAQQSTPRKEQWMTADDDLEAGLPVVRFRSIL